MSHPFQTASDVRKQLEAEAASRAVVCRNCGGNGEIKLRHVLQDESFPCKRCNGSGLEFETHIVTPAVPPLDKLANKFEIFKRVQGGVAGSGTEKFAIIETFVCHDGYRSRIVGSHFTSHARAALEVGMEYTPPEDNSSDHEIAIAEDAFKAGHEAGVKSATSEGFAGMSLAMEAQMAEEAWDAYTPPEELCGGGTRKDEDQ